MKFSHSISADISQLQEGISFIEDSLKKCACKSNQVIKSALLIEEMLVSLIQKSDANQQIKMTVTKRLGTTKVHLNSKGAEFSESEFSDKQIDLSKSELDPDSESIIRGLLLKANSEKITFSYKNGINRIQLFVGEATQKNLIYAICALCAAIVIGIPMRMFLPQSIADGLNEYLFSPIKTIFLNALKMVMAPLIFFSIASCVSTFKDIRKLGRMGGKIMAFYIFTTTVAISVGLLLFYTVSPGQFGEFTSLNLSEAAPAVNSVNFKDTLLGIIPSNLLQPFVTANTLQIIFLAILIGIAAGSLGKHSERVSEFLSLANSLFMKVAFLITKFLPLMIFASVVSMALTMKFETAKTLISLVGTILLADACMLVAYILLVTFLGKTNPFQFIKKALSAWLNAFAIVSSNAAMAHTMEVCDKKLRISPKLYSFSIPLGATINMDGLSVMLSLTTLFFASAFGITLSPADILSLIFTIVVLSVGTPGIPGTGLICLSVLFKQCGIPIEALSIFVGVYSLLDPINTANNVFGDVTGTYIVAKRSKFIQEKSEK